MGSQAATIVLERSSTPRRQPDIKVKTMLGRNALDHNLIWDEKSIALAKELGDTIAFGLNSELWSPRIVRGEEMLLRAVRRRLSTVQPVKDLVGAGFERPLRGGQPGRAAALARPAVRHARRSRSRLAASGARPRRGRTAGDAHVGTSTSAVDRKQALRMVTIAAARFISEEKMLGSIEKGKYADLVVLNGDYLARAGRGNRRARAGHDHRGR